MMSNEERDYMLQKQEEQRKRAKVLSELDEIAERDAEDNKNPNVGRITVRSPDGTVKHIYNPPKKNNTEMEVI